MLGSSPASCQLEILFACPERGTAYRLGPRFLQISKREEKPSSSVVEFFCFVKVCDQKG